MSRIKWTESMDLRVREMATAGKSASEIAAALYIKKEQVYSRLAYLKQKGYVIGGLDGRTMPKMGDDKKKGKLNDMEKAMAETIRELTEERDNIAERLAVYEHDYGDLLKKNENCLSQIAELSQTVEQMRGEVADTQEALSRTEIQLDEARREAAAHLAKVGEQIKTISDLEARVFGAESDQLAKYLEIGKLKDRLDGRDAEIEELTRRLELAAEKAGQLLTQVLMMGE